MQESRELLLHDGFRMLSVNERMEVTGTCGHSQLMDSVLSICHNISIEHSLIAVHMPKHPAVVAVIVAILRSQNAFIYISHSCREFVESECVSQGASMLISSSISSDVAENVFGLKIFFTLYKRTPIEAFNTTPVCYVMQTSGTTGKPKSVLVPYSAILPNIRDFSERFKVTSNEVILHSTTLTFDPSIVELFLALSIGCTLLVVPDSFRSQPSMLAYAMLKFNATLAQLTPSLVEVMPHSALTKLFSAESSLRVLILGGEPFPSQLLRKYVTPLTGTCVYNVYGVTEVSCWASCRRWSLTDDEVDIGEPLLETALKIDGQGELLIGGTRQCFLNGKLSKEWTRTGDLAERLPDGRIFLRGRRDDQVKVRGVRVNLSEVANAAQCVEGVRSAMAMCWRGKAIVLFVDASIDDVANDLRKRIPTRWMPHAIVNVNQWPLNPHGKVDRNALMDVFEKRNCSSTQNVSSILADYGIDVKYQKGETFRSLGMTSLRATELMVKLDHLIDKSDFELLQLLLSETATVDDLLRLLQVDASIPKAESCCGASMVNEISPIKEPYNSSLAWEWNSGKCIDGTPIVHKGNVLIGSHSGHFASIRISDGHMNWEIELSDRIEATASLQYEIVVVGCYDHYVYFLDEREGRIVWKFETGDAVKSTPVFVCEGKCVIGSHDHSLYLLNYQAQSKVWQAECGGALLATPLICRDTVIAATLAGELACFQLDSGTRVWEMKLGSPIFASPCSVNDSSLMVADVRGNVSLHQISSGRKVDEVALNESIFAEPFIINSSIGLLLTQKGSIVVVALDHLRLLKSLSVPSSAFVRPPVLSSDNIFIQDTTGRLFAFPMSTLQSGFEGTVSDRREHKPLRNSEKSQSHDAIVIDQQKMQADSTVLESASGSKEVINIDGTVSHNILTESINEVLSQDAETFGGVAVFREDEDESKNFNSFRILVGCRDDYLRCYIVDRKRSC